MSTKVLFLNYEYPPLGGGGANATFYLLKEFAKIPDLSVDLVTSKAGGPPVVEQFSERIRLHKLPIRKKSFHYWTQGEVFASIMSAYPYVVKLMTDGSDFDVCHAFFTIPGGLVAYLLKSRFPYIVSLRGSDVPGFNNRFSSLYVVLKPIVRRIWSKAFWVTANSRGLKELALQTKPDQPIDIVFNGVDTKEFAPLPERKRGSGGYTIICVSRLIERKGLDRLIAALPMIKPKIPGVRLALVGEGDLEMELKKSAAKFGVGDLIDWLGYVEHAALPEIYARGDIFVLPSKNEGMSNSLLEAMACGLPVVVSDTGGTAELVESAGVVLKDLSPKETADKVIELASDQELAAVSARKSRMRALEFSWTTVAAVYAEKYREAAARRRRV